MDRARARWTAAAFAGIFLLVTAAVLSGVTQRFDERVLLSLRRAGDPAVPAGGPALKEAVRDLSALGGEATLVCVTLAAAEGLWLLRRRREALTAILLPLAALAVSEALKAAVARPRPDVVPGLAFVATRSFPSGHSLMSAAVYLTLARIAARGASGRAWPVFCLGAAAALTLLIGATRIYLGVHYPTDVLAGWCLGAAIATLAYPRASDNA